MDQDSYNLPRVQKGMNSRAYKGLLINYRERRIRHMHLMWRFAVRPIHSGQHRPQFLAHVQRIEGGLELRERRRLPELEGPDR